MKLYLDSGVLKVITIVQINKTDPNSYVFLKLCAISGRNSFFVNSSQCLCGAIGF